MQCVCRWLTVCRQFIDVRDFCRNKLGISDARLRYLPWPELLHRLVLLQRSLKLSLRADLSEHAIVMRICRRDDFLVGAASSPLFLPSRLLFVLASAGPAACLPLYVPSLARNGVQACSIRGHCHCTCRCQACARSRS